MRFLDRSRKSQRYFPCGKGAVTIVYASHQGPALTGFNWIREDVFPYREKLLADAVEQFLKAEIGNGMSLTGTSVNYIVGNFDRCIHGKLLQSANTQARTINLIPFIVEKYIFCFERSMLSRAPVPTHAFVTYSSPHQSIGDKPSSVALYVSFSSSTRT